MGKFIPLSARKFTHVDWLLNGPRFYDTGPVQDRAGLFWRENRRADFLIEMLLSLMHSTEVPILGYSHALVVREDISWGAKSWIWIIFNYSVDVYFVARAVNSQLLEPLWKLGKHVLV